MERSPGRCSLEAEQMIQMIHLDRNSSSAYITPWITRLDHFTLPLCRRYEGQSGSSRFQSTDCGHHYTVVTTDSRPHKFHTAPTATELMNLPLFGASTNLLILRMERVRRWPSDFPALTLRSPFGMHSSAGASPQFASACRHHSRESFQWEWRSKWFLNDS